jgi:sn-glycerol 3-phosphate transport system substrate-binding protein
MLIDTSTAITSVNGAIEGTLDPADLGVEGDDELSGVISGIQLDSLRIVVGLNPGLEAAGKGQIGGAGWYMVDNGDEAPIAGAWDFLQFFNETPNQVRWTLEGSYLPVSEAAREDPAMQEEFTTTRRGKWLAVATTSLDELDPDFPGPVIGPYNQFRSLVRDSFEKITLDGQEIDPTVDAVNESFQDALDEYANDVGA